MRHPDVLVVGAGAAGSALAARLSEDPGRRVLLLEAGSVPARPEDFGIGLLDARLVPGAQPGQPAVRPYQVHLTDRVPYTVPRGRILGGSTTVNGGYFVRARRDDFDRWSAAAGHAWSFDRALPLMRALETDLDYGATDVHGGTGPVHIRRVALDHPAAAAFAAAASERGYPAEPDKNAQGAPGFGPLPGNAVDGVRVNTGISYVLNALVRPNLTVLGECSVVRVLIRAGRAVGVEVERSGRREVVEAGEVVLCAGAFGSAHLLLLSGVGPRGDLGRLGIPVTGHVPAVGAAFGDHPQVVVEWTPRFPLAAPVGSWLAGALHLPSAGSPYPGDLEILQSLTPIAGLVGGDAGPLGAPLPFLVSVQTPRARGRLRLVSADASVPPRIHYGYLTTAGDRRRMREAVRYTADLIGSPAFGAVARGPVDLDGAVLGDDTALDAWVAAHLGTSQHTCGTVPMGAPDDPAAAVDQYGKVRGITALRVADTSILPSAPLRGPAATAVLIGEVVADAMRRGLT